MNQQAPGDQPVRNTHTIPTRTLTYSGDVTRSLKSVIGGRSVVMASRYDAEANKTYVEVAKLTDPMRLLDAGLLTRDGEL